MYKILLAISALIFSVLLSGCSRLYGAVPEEITMFTMADYPHYNSIDDLAERADIIVKVDILDERVEISGSVINFMANITPIMGLDIL